MRGGFIDFDRRHDNDMALRHIDDRHRGFGERQKQSLALLKRRDFKNIAAAKIQHLDDRADRFAGLCSSQ